MTQEKFKLPRSSYEELLKIITAYGTRAKPASLDDIHAASGVGRSVVSDNNKFLSAVEIIEGGNKKIATEQKGKKLSSALDHEIPEDISNAWRTIVEESDFLNKMVQAVRIRKGMEISSLGAHIAYSAGEPKSPKVMTGARTVIDILLNSGLVKEDNDRIIPAKIRTAEIAPTAEEKYVPSVDKVLTTKVFTSPAFSLNIEVRIDAKPSDLDDGLGEQLKTLIKTLSSSVPEGEKSDESAEQEG